MPTRTILDYFPSSKTKNKKSKKTKTIEKDTPKTQEKTNNHKQNLLKSHSSEDVSPIYQNIKNRGTVGIISKLIFSDEVDFKEPDTKKINEFLNNLTL